MPTLLYNGTHGPDDPTRATMPFHFAAGAVDAGHHGADRSLRRRGNQRAQLLIRAPQ